MRSFSSTSFFALLFFRFLKYRCFGPMTLTNWIFLRTNCLWFTVMKKFPRAMYSIWFCFCLCSSFWIVWARSDLVLSSKSIMPKLGKMNRDYTYMRCNNYAFDSIIVWSVSQLINWSYLETGRSLMFSFYKIWQDFNMTEDNSEPKDS